MENQKLITGKWILGRYDVAVLQRVISILEIFLLSDVSLMEVALLYSDN